MYLRDPQRTELGQRILAQSILLIDQLGLEDFNFKRLAIALHTAEASIYRYFENKHRLLVYLVSWYWNWLEECLEVELHNLTDPEERLRRAIRVLVTGGRDFTRHAPPHPEALYRLVIAEASKAYLTKAVDAENREGLFRDYKRLVGHVAQLIQNYAPGYPYPHTLVSLVIETGRKQQFFAHHLPLLTDFTPSDNLAQELAGYLEGLVLGAVHTPTTPTPLMATHNGK
ncbi:MAG: TetR/AcrR family transcriptional regulator [Bacteroidia bacterium]|nr:TetR/AcrR family transcriptional regulator [Bacteroidia bacterium]